jgi:hypothetical protein
VSDEKNTQQLYKHIYNLPSFVGLASVAIPGGVINRKCEGVDKPLKDSSPFLIYFTSTIDIMK